MPAYEPHDLHQLFVTAVGARDLHRLLDLYEPKAMAVDLTGQPVHGTVALRQFLGSFVAAVRSIRGNTRAVQVAGDLALLSSVWHAEVVGPQGQVTEAEGTSTEIARRQADGTWRFVIDDPLFGSRVIPS